MPRDATSPIRARPIDWLLLICLGMIWGASFMATKIATDDLGPFAITGMRLALAAFAINLVRLVSGERMPGIVSGRDRRFWVFALLIAVTSNALPFLLLSWAQAHIDSGLAGILMTTVPFFVLPLGHVFVAGERMTLQKTLGFIVGFTGVAVLIGPEALGDLGAGGRVALLAQCACLGVAICYAAGSIGARLAPDRGLIPLSTAALSLAALMTLPLAVALDPTLTGAQTMASLVAVGYLGLVPTALATVMLLAVVRSAGPGFLALVNYQVPVWAVVFGTVFLGEEPSPRLGVALALIAAGLAISQGALGRRRDAHAQG
ncbi:MAG: DMT family transporter [Pseudomonadota bacterium]